MTVIERYDTEIMLADALTKSSWDGDGEGRQVVRDRDVCSFNCTVVKIT